MFVVNIHRREIRVTHIQGRHHLQTAIQFGALPVDMVYVNGLLTTVALEDNALIESTKNRICRYQT